MREALRASFRWRGDRTDDHALADPTGWWADPQILREIGPALAALFADAEPTVIVGLQSRGTLLGALVAAHLGVGLVEVRKDPSPSADSDRWFVVHTPPDYQDRTLRLGARADHLTSDDRVLVVDDWVQTGGQLLGVREIVTRARASWCGVALVVDGVGDSSLRRNLNLRSLLHVRDL